MGDKGGPLVRELLLLDQRLHIVEFKNTPCGRSNSVLLVIENLHRQFLDDSQELTVRPSPLSFNLHRASHTLLVLLSVDIYVVVELDLEPDLS